VSNTKLNTETSHQSLSSLKEVSIKMQVYLLTVKRRKKEEIDLY